MPNESKFEIKSRLYGLYELLLGQVSSVPNVQLREKRLLDYALQLEFPDVERGADGNIRCTYNHKTNYLSLGEIIVGYERKCKFKLLGHRFGDKPLASLDDVRTALSQVPEIGEPLYHDDNFLFYETLGQVEKWGSPKFDLTIVGNKSFIHGTSSTGIFEINSGRINEISFEDESAEGFIKAHVAKYGRDRLEGHFGFDKKVVLPNGTSSYIYNTDTRCDMMRDAHNIHRCSL